MTEDAPLVVRYGPLSATASVRLAWIAVVSLFAATLRPLTLPATALVVVIGVATVWSANSRDAGAAADVHPSTAHVVTWATLFVVLCLWELAAFLLGDDDQHVTFSTLMDPVIGSYGGRLLVWVGWLSFGDWLVRRP